MTNSLQTLCALFYAIFKRQATDVGLDVINTIFDIHEIEEQMKRLVVQCNNILISMLNITKVTNNYYDVKTLYLFSQMT